MSLKLRSQKFREEREDEWRRLNSLVDKAEQGKLRSLPADALLDLPVLYRNTISSLSLARSISLDAALIDYLEALCARAYVCIYGPQGRAARETKAFFLGGWSRAVRAIGWELGVAAAFLLAGTLAGYGLCAADPGWFSALIDPAMTQGRDPQASAAELKKTLGGANEHRGLFAVFLATHNITVSVSAFAMGVVLGLPTLYFMLENGLTLGAMISVFAAKGLGVDFLGWLSIHGTTELLAIAIAGACGLHLGRAVLSPGEQERLAALAAAGKRTGVVMLGVGIMLLIAGALEGIGRQTVTETWARFAVGGGMALFWALYFGLAGRKAGAGDGA